MNLRATRVSLLAFVLGMTAAAAQAVSQTDAPIDPHLKKMLSRPAPVQPDAYSAKYVGAGSCAASACHGGIQPRTTTKVLQNEFSTWITTDKHATAYNSLKGPLGEQIASTLKIGPAEKAQKCLVCHAVSVADTERARDFDIADGVSCESCHGPASRWLGPHIQAKAVHADMVKLGLVDNKSLTVRTQQCLTCHLGARGLDVDHELIAAGHPDLTFELDSFSAVEPTHWVEKNANGEPADSLFGARAWAIGQAVQLEQGMLRLSRRAQSGPWPEFSEMDCMTCHHALTGPQSWRQQTGFQGHRAGDPTYNLSRLILFKHFAAEVDPRLSDELAAEAGKVAMLVTSMSPNRSEVEASANRTAALARQMADEVVKADFDRTRTERLLRAIASDADAISLEGERTAEQATMTIDSLYIADAKAGNTNPATRQAIDGLFVLVKNPSAYNGPQFAAGLKKVRSTLR